MKKNLIKESKGFTIIEVLIVLAIAGLIMAVVLIAIPGLQRSQANTAAKTDATHIVAALTDFVSNNNGSLPSTPADFVTVYKSVAGINKLLANNLTSGTPTIGVLSGTGTSQNWYNNIGGMSTSAITTTEWLVDIDTDAQCVNSSGTVVSSVSGATLSTINGTTPTQVALLYTTQISGGSEWNCLQAQ